MTIDTHLLRQQQIENAQRVVLRDEDLQPTLIGGADVGFEQQGAITRAVIAVLSWPDLQLVEYQIARIPTQLPYIPGLLSFREVPGLVAAWEQLNHKPELVLVDGQGIAHPRRFGVACHFGLQVDIPTIGVAKSRLYGDYKLVDEEKDSVQPLTHGEEPLGWVLRSKKRCNPLFISPGHKVSVDSSLKWVEGCLKGYRLPEPTRFADGIASNRAFFERMKGKSS
ncbi:deoxyribonuclease V [Providencia vermicola]|uniref:Endonuclease V n=2 Tax=Providencia TaxID=586 RepID=A0AAI9HXI5_PROST|nr:MULTISPECIES: deoxyribonuclease V [Providencia]ELR5044935.1 deoxyribonuclease V [Providencia rettgeri]ELR5034633.1 deoxyribonuclease V [Providencia stuartii]ELR5123212.1 deoxyribonuclease V [Providencia stuartii]ELR5143602.1 deoxyribonuclease V [Providencia stuartii]ELR5293700.1 deoxyribonuclease V [Providencia stuartii]